MANFQAINDSGSRQNDLKPKPETTVSEERLDQIHDELLDAECVCEMGDVLTPLSDHELEFTYSDFMIQYGYELALGALERSEWMCGTLVINANQPSIGFIRTALDLMRGEIENRKTAAVQN